MNTNSQQHLSTEQGFKIVTKSSQKHFAEDQSHFQTEIDEHFKALTKNIEVVFIDIDGTIINNTANTVMINAVESIDKLREAGFKVRFVSNLIKGSKQALHYHMRKFGFRIEIDEIFTSVCATRIYIDKNELQPYLAADDSIVSYFNGVSTEKPNCVVLGPPSSQFHYELLPNVHTLLTNGAPLITYHRGERDSINNNGVELAPSVKYSESLANTTAILIAKPSSEFFNYAMEQSEFKPEECVMIGDDIFEDIAGSLNCGILGILVRTGKYRSGDEEIIEPTLTVDNFSIAIEHLLQARKTNLVNIIGQVRSTEYEVRLEAVKTIRTMLCRSTRSSINLLLDCGSLPILIKCLRTTSNPELQLEVLWTLTNITTGTSGQTTAVVESGAVPLVIKLLSSPHEGVCEQAVWTLGNIIGDGPELRDYTVYLGVLDPLVNYITREQDASTSLIELVSWVVVNLVRHRYLYHSLPPEILCDIISALALLIHRTEKQILFNGLLAFAHLTHLGGSEKFEKIQMVVDNGILPKLVSLVSHVEPDIKLTALQVVSNVVGAEKHIQDVLDHGILTYLHKILSENNEKCCIEALRILSTVMTHGDIAKVQAVVDAQLTPLINDHLQGGKYVFDTKKEAAVVVRNMAAVGTRDQIKYVVDCGVIQNLCDLLLVELAGVRITRVLLQAIYNILKTISAEESKLVCKIIQNCGGFSKLFTLNRGTDIYIQEESYKILGTYFYNIDLENFLFDGRQSQDASPQLITYFWHNEAGKYESAEDKRKYADSYIHDDFLLRQSILDRIIRF